MNEWKKDQIRTKRKEESKGIWKKTQKNSRNDHRKKKKDEKKKKDKT